MWRTNAWSCRQWNPLHGAAILLAFASLLPVAWAAGTKTAADYYVSSLPGAPSPLLRMFAGHIEITPEHHGNMFFWLFKNKHIAERQRTVIWLNGGPGCSSMDGALMEVGPYRVNEDGTLRLIDGSWDEFANVIFVDNPVGTGFSYVDGDSYLHELDEMAAQMVKFLTMFFEIFPEHEKDDLYIAGESYAGQHIPYVARAMLERNKAHHGQEWNVSGLLIGNGWMSGPEQYPSYISYAYEAGLLQAGSQAERQLLAQQEQCTKDLAAGGKDHVDTESCEQILQEMLNLLKKDNDHCVNMYDVRLTDSYPSCGMNWPPDLKWMTPYLRRDDVKKALHINPDKKTGWQECNNQISNTFKAYKSVPSVKLLPDLLEKLPIILFAGDKDLICNYIGIEDMISKLDFNGGKGFETSPGTWAPRLDWTFEDEPAGFYQSARNLTYIRFYNSSHMVPFDYPRRTRDMLDRALGVDIASIGGNPADSRVGGEKGLETSVGGHPNSTAAIQAETEKVSEATWAAYRRSGEVALVVVVIAAIAWFYFIWRDRRRRAGYSSLFGSDPNGSSSQIRLSTGLGLDGSSSQRRSKWTEQRDVEAARDFDEAELDDLTSQGQKRDLEASGFGLASDDDDDDDDPNHHRHTGANGHT